MTQRTVSSDKLAVGELHVRAFGAKYVLVRKLAEGGMAEIFLAKQVGVEGFERDVVIKRMLQHLSSVPDFVNMFLDEARLASRLAHPNVVQINDLGFTDGCYFIAMEYLPGEDFSTVLRTAARRREYVPLSVSLKVLSEAAHGLHFAHTFADAQGNPLNIVHRDISPSNIFVTYTGQVKVLDFGIARAESRVTQTTAGVVKGKYQYMSPEQARSDQVDRRADVYSLGVSAYEAFTNTRPFARDTDLAILNAVLKNEYRPLREVRPDLPLELEQLVVKALRPEAADRQQSAQEFAGDLERVLMSKTGAGGTGSLSLAAYMSTLFGPERVQAKTRIDSLVELAKKGVDVPGYSNPYAPKTDAESTGVAVNLDAAPSEEATKAVAPQSVVAMQRQRKRGAVAIAGTVAAVLLVLGGYLGYRGFGGGAGASAGGGAGGPDVVALDAGAAVVVPLPVVDAGVAEVVADAGAVAAGGGSGGERPNPIRPVRLTQANIMAVVRRSAGRVTKCLEQHQGDLPADRGNLDVTFTILPTGRTTGVVSGAAQKAVGKCVEGVVKAMHFPPHVDKEVTITVPFAYEKK